MTLLYNFGSQTIQVNFSIQYKKNRTGTYEQAMHKSGYKKKQQIR